VDNLGSAGHDPDSLVGWKEPQMTAVQRHVVEPIMDAEVRDFLASRDVHYEVIDGRVLMNAWCEFDHESVLSSLFLSLGQAAPVGVVVLGSNLGFHYQPGSYVLPDIVVARREDCQREGTFVAPLLIVEVLSPSTRWVDLGRKREIYAAAGVASYWVVDPTAQVLTVLSLQDGGYVETAHLEGPGELVLTEPFAVRVAPWA
jgi:Uma2 family endonuclease